MSSVAYGSLWAMGKSIFPKRSDLKASERATPYPIADIFILTYTTC